MGCEFQHPDSVIIVKTLIRVYMDKATKCYNHRRQLRQIKTISVFLETSLKILDREGTHIFFSGKKYNFMHFERHFAFRKA